MQELGISSAAMTIMESFIQARWQPLLACGLSASEHIRFQLPKYRCQPVPQDMFERIAGEAARLMHMHSKRTMTAQVLCLANALTAMRQSYIRHAESGGQGSISR